MLHSRVKGKTEIRHVQGLIRIAPAQIQAQIARSVRPIMRRIEPEVKTEAGTLPRRGGYAPLMARAVRVRTQVRQSGHRIIARADVSARGKREERDVRAVNAGILRHPVFGRRKVWRVTNVLPGFVNRPIDRARDRIVDAVKEARDDAAERIVRG